MAPEAEGRWEFWVDRGGTFTDVVARAPGGALRVLKLLSVNPACYEDAALHAIRQVLEIDVGDPSRGRAPAPIPPSRVRRVVLGTTVATNALLERRGARTLLLVTEGFRDVCEIADQSRADIFALDVKKPAKLYSAVVEVRGRVRASDGSEIVPLDEGKLEADLARAAADASRAGAPLEAAAVCLLHGYAHPAHEARVAASCARVLNIPPRHVSTSLIAPLCKVVPRADTCCVDAYLTPVLAAYTAKVEAAFCQGEGEGGRTRVEWMTSSGGLAQGGHCFRGKDAILSGPAGGIVAAVHTASHHGVGSRLITFDMGGTSTDVAHYCAADASPSPSSPSSSPHQTTGRIPSQGPLLPPPPSSEGGKGKGDEEGEGGREGGREGEDAPPAYERTYEGRVAGVRVRAPMMRIHTVASGGGSVCRWDGLRLRVGPHSAGADPGPACYGKGGPCTVTDCHVVARRLHPDHFPKCFGPHMNAPLDYEAAKERLLQIQHAMDGKGKEGKEGKEGEGEGEGKEGEGEGEGKGGEGVRCGDGGMEASCRLASLAMGLVSVAVDQMAQAIKTISVQRGYDVSQGYVLQCFGGAGGQHACMVRI